MSWLLVSVWLTLGMVDQSAAISTPAASAYELGNAFCETLDWTTEADLGFDAQFFGHYHVTADILSFQAPGPLPEFSPSLETFSIGAYATFGAFTFRNLALVSTHSRLSGIRSAVRSLRGGTHDRLRHDKGNLRR